LASFRSITRKELYDLVWSRPMRDVAMEFGISDVGLAKTCARHGIPTPPRGYWARVQAGQKVQQQPLSRPAEAERQNITINATTSRVPQAVRDVLAESKRPKNDGSVDEVDHSSSEPFPVVDLHKSIKLTALTLRKTKPAASGAIHATEEGMHGVVVSPAQVERAVFIIDGLTRRLEREGLTVAPAGAATQVTAGPDKLSFTLMERTRRVRHVPTDTELKAEEQRKKRLERRWTRSDTWTGVGLSDFDKTYPEWDTVYIGELAVQIDGYGGQGIRKRWADGKTQKVERMLDEIALGMRAYLAAEKSGREEREERELQRLHLERRREKARLRRERESKRLAFLENLTDQQREVARLTEWLAAPQANAGSENLERMNSWVRDRLAALQLSLAAPGIEAGLNKLQLFPEVDGLHDPEGEPPESRYGF
jgi:hypothetical protein